MFVSIGLLEILTFSLQSLLNGSGVFAFFLSLFRNSYGDSSVYFGVGIGFRGLIPKVLSLDTLGAPF
jgi:hypothetical protein